MKAASFIHIIQYKLNCELNNIKRKNALSRKKNDIFSYFKKHTPQNKEIEEALNYLKDSPLHTFCAPFREA